MLKHCAPLALLACCSCSALTDPSQFAVRCSGSQSITADDEDATSLINAAARTYVIDWGRKTIYRADPYVVANLCMPDGRCDVEITPNRVTALLSKPFGTGPNRTITDTRFELDRDKGKLQLTDVMRIVVDGEPGSPITTEGTFTCVSTPVPKFQVPES